MRERREKKAGETNGRNKVRHKIGLPKNEHAKWWVKERKGEKKAGETDRPGPKERDTDRE